MTLCIAADCWLGEKQCLVFCCDTRAERGGTFHELIGSNDAWKIREIGSNVALLSGSETPADDLLALCDKTIQEFGKRSVGESDIDLAVSEFRRKLEGFALERKKRIVDHWLRFNFTMTRDEFIANHKTQLDPVKTREIWKGIEFLDLGADIIICGFQDGESVIVRLDRYGKSHWETNYSAVGAGADIAFSFLCQRDWDERPSLMQGAYYLMEAKRAAEANRHVGEMTILQFMMPDGKRFYLTKKAQGDLDRRIIRQRKTKPIEFSESMLEPVDEEESGQVASSTPSPT